MRRWWYLFLMVGCDPGTCGTKYQVTMTNNGLEPVHLFMETEDFAKSNKVKSFSSRTAFIVDRDGSFRDSVQIYAGNNGVELGTTACTVDAEDRYDNLDYVDFVATWTGTSWDLCTIDDILGD